jgi:hypothetical protein
MKHRRFTHLAGLAVKRSPLVNTRRLKEMALRLCRDAWTKRRLRLGKTLLDKRDLQTALVKGLSADTFGTVLRQRADARFFIPRAFKAELVEALIHLDPTIEKRTIEAAESVCSHRFDLLGSGETQLGHIIDWHTDFKTGYRWPQGTYYKKIDGRYLVPDSDIKVPWELSRCQHLPTLGRAYWHTGDERYAAEFVAQVGDWIATNRPASGVNWACPMDVAIRAVNWLWAYYLILDSPHLTADFEHAFFASLLAHGRHILTNLEGYPGAYNSNHYLSDLAGLIFLGLLLPEFRESQRWLQVGVTGLSSEIGRQVLDDGADYELSISYHRLVAEIFLTCGLLCKKNGVQFPSSYWARLERMIDFTWHYTRPDGTVPILGDADNGRLQRLASWSKSEREFFDHRHLLAAGGVLFDRPGWAAAAGPCWEEAFWLMGETASRYWQAHRGAPAENAISKAFPDAGLFVQRDGELYSLFEAGGNGTGGSGGHCHNDTLSFELYAYGYPFIIDPGSFVYTSDAEARNLFRSTRYHNTVQVDGEELNRLAPSELFMMADDATPHMEYWKSTEELDLVVAYHDGYLRLPDPVCVRRSFLFDKQGRLWVVRDDLIAEGEHEYKFFFHFGQVVVRASDDHERRFIAEAPGGPSLALWVIEGPGLEARISQGWISSSYGKRVQAPVLQFTGRLSGRHSVFWGLCPSNDALPPGEKIRRLFESSRMKFNPVAQQTTRSAT